MGKISYDEKLRMQTLREQGFGAKAIVAKYPRKGWKLRHCLKDLPAYRSEWFCSASSAWRWTTSTVQYSREY